MALTDSQKVDILWKSLQKRATSSTAKAFYEEANYSVSSVMGSQIWSQAEQIPTPAVASSSAVISYHASVLLSEDVTVTGQKSFKTPLTDWIHPSIDGSYQVRVYQNNGSGGLGAEVPPTDTSDWVFDYNSGTLTFFGTNTSHVKPYLIKGWRYIGLKGVSVATSTFSDTFSTGDWGVDAGSDALALNFVHGLGTSSLQVDVFESLAESFFKPTHVDWVANDTTLKLLISTNASFSGKLEVRIL